MNRFRTRFTAKAFVLFTLCSFVFPVHPRNTAAEEPQATTAIKHKPIEYFVADKRIVIEAEVTDKELIKLVRCYFRAAAEATYVFVPMEAGNENVYQSILPAPAKNTAKLEYLFLVVNGKNRVVRSQVFTVDRKDQEKTPPWQQSSHSGDIHVSTELPTATEAPQGFNDSIVMDVVESSARFGFVADNIYLGSQMSAAAGATDTAAAASGTAAAAGTVSSATAAVAAGTAAGVITGTAATAVSAGVVVATTGISTAVIVGAGAVVVAGGAAAAAAGGGGSGGGSSPPAPVPTPTSSPVPRPSTIPVPTPTVNPNPTPTINPIPTPVVSPIPSVTPIPTPVPSDCSDLAGTWTGSTTGSYCDGTSGTTAIRSLNIQSSCSFSLPDLNYSSTLSRSGNSISFQVNYQYVAVNKGCEGNLGTAQFNGQLSTSGTTKRIDGSYNFPAGSAGSFSLTK